MSEFEELKYDTEFKDEVIGFLLDFDNNDDRDRFHVAELIYGVPEQDIKKWCWEKTKVILQDTLLTLEHTRKAFIKGNVSKEIYRRKLEFLLSDLKKYNTLK